MRSGWPRWRVRVCYAPPEVLDQKGRLARASRDELFEALSSEQFRAVHRFVAADSMQRIEQIEQRIARLARRLLEGLRPWRAQLELLQTLPPASTRRVRPCCWWRSART